MRDIKFSKVIDHSIDWTLSVLWGPFSAKKWMRLILIAWLAGSLGSCSGSGGGNHAAKPPVETHSAASTAASSYGSGSVVGGNATTATSVVIYPHAPARPALPSAASIKNKVRAAVRHKNAPVIFAVLAALMLLFLVFFNKLNAMFKFVWFNAVALNTAEISEPCGRLRKQARSLFGYQLSASFVTLGVFGVLAAWAFWAGDRADVSSPAFVWSPGSFCGVFGVPLSLAVVFAAAVIAWSVAVDHFIVVIMAMNGRGFIESAKQFFAVFRERPSDFWRYLFAVFCLGVLGGAIALVALILIVIGLALCALLVFGLGYLLFAALLKIKWLFAIYVILAGVPFAVLALFVCMSPGLILAVFFRSLGMHFLISQRSTLLPETLEIYAASVKKEQHKSPFLLLIALVLILAVPVVGILAAIAIPNFVAARKAAIERAASRPPAVP